jgi:hypothetical protein
MLPDYARGFPAAKLGERLSVPRSMTDPASERAKRTLAAEVSMIRKLSSGGYRLYSKKKNPKTGRRRNLGTFKTRAAAEKHERAVQYFKRA